METTGATNDMIASRIVGKTSIWAALPKMVRPTDQLRLTSGELEHKYNLVRNGSVYPRSEGRDKRGGCGRTDSAFWYDEE